MDDTRELAIAIIEKFEELLNKHSIKLPNEERQGDKNEASIYGKDYFDLEDEITELLNNRISCKK